MQLEDKACLLRFKTFFCQCNNMILFFLSPRERYYVHIWALISFFRIVSASARPFLLSSNYRYGIDYPSVWWPFIVKLTSASHTEILAGEGGALTPHANSPVKSRAVHPSPCAGTSYHTSSRRENSHHGSTSKELLLINRNQEIFNRCLKSTLTA